MLPSIVDAASGVPIRCGACPPGYTGALLRTSAGRCHPPGLGCCDGGEWQPPFFLMTLIVVCCFACRRGRDHLQRRQRVPGLELLLPGRAMHQHGPCVWGPMMPWPCAGAHAPPSARTRRPRSDPPDTPPARPPARPPRARRRARSSAERAPPDSGGTPQAPTGAARSRGAARRATGAARRARSASTQRRGPCAVRGACPLSRVVSNSGGGGWGALRGG